MSEETDFVSAILECSCFLQRLQSVSFFFRHGDFGRSDIVFGFPKTCEKLVELIIG